MYIQTIKYGEILRNNKNSSPIRHQPVPPAAFAPATHFHAAGHPVAVGLTIQLTAKALQRVRKMLLRQRHRLRVMSICVGYFSFMKYSK